MCTDLNSQLGDECTVTGTHWQPALAHPKATPAMCRNPRLPRMCTVALTLSNSFVSAEIAVQAGWPAERGGFKPTRPFDSTLTETSVNQCVPNLNHFGSLERG